MTRTHKQRQASSHAKYVEILQRADKAIHDVAQTTISEFRGGDVELYPEIPAQS